MQFSRQNVSKCQSHEEKTEESRSSEKIWDQLYFENPSYSYLRRLLRNGEDRLVPKGSVEERHESHETRMVRGYIENKLMTIFLASTDLSLS